MAALMQKTAVTAVALWVLMLIYLSSQMFSIQNSHKGSEDNERLSSLLSETLQSMKDLRKQNSALKEMIEAERAEHSERSRAEKQDRLRLFREIRGMKGGADEKGGTREKVVDIATEERKLVDSSLYSKDHEISRRKLDRDIWEVFYHLHNQFKKHNEKLDFLANSTEDQLISLLGTSRNFSLVDGSDKWRKDELSKLTEKIQNKIQKLQNPADCSKARVLLCTLDKECGFGCQLHHVAYCLVTAFGEGRTMVFHSNGAKWRYSSKGWDGAFLPITNCTYEKTLKSGEHPTSFTEKNPSRVVNLGIVDALAKKPAHLPLSFPSAIQKELLTLHSNPPLFFISQFLWYLMRSNEIISSIVKKAAEQVPFGKGPIVGLQVRRTDKVGTEAAFHAIEEYMEWTEIWFRVREKSEGRYLARKVYIATDDPTVVPEAKRKYPNYEVYGDIKIANTAQMNSRYSDSSLHGVVTDIRLLSMCDYLVCTFSSQVCRMGYELMQISEGDAGELFHSLDDLYYYGGQFPHEQIVIEDHFPSRREEIELKVGDVVGVAGNHWDGWSKGHNRRTDIIGLYPSYKVVEKWRIVDFDVLN